LHLEAAITFRLSSFWAAAAATAASKADTNLQARDKPAQASLAAALPLIHCINDALVHSIHTSTFYRVLETGCGRRIQQVSARELREISEGAVNANAIMEHTMAFDTWWMARDQTLCWQTVCARIQ
jgi:hypothetical protein